MHTLNVSQFSALVGKSVKTLQRWDRSGRLTAGRDSSNRRIYTEDHVGQVLGARRKAPRKVVVYCRVSSAAQKTDLLNQRAALETFCQARGIVVDEWVTETGGGLNFKRPKFLSLMDGIGTGEVGTVVIAHRDRLVRFGFDLVKHLAERAGCEILVLNSESLSPEQEMIQDMLAITHCFSARLYGLRNYRKALQKAIQDDQNPQNQA